ncbi:YoaK family protein [Pseudonocardia xinjiangensis]|uniref:DUF1275 domain-containing protein n=1 Tax=Pseudonocardia xinjiangensis TaxID=75289 RepID=A0ABX1R6R5_9PSEU|nr:YoaK family protein [Pseudonocardia xinjiangensis]NMH76081.1 DUF1275 domain-containing protein [Pseudonocardia xinjiangensis]
MDHRRAHLVLILALTFSTGVVDAVGYLDLDRVFTANMTGNVVMLGMALLGSEDLPVARLALAPAGYLVGAALAAWVLRAARGGWSTRTSALLGTVAGVVLVLALVLPRLGAHPADPVGSVVTSVLAMAMGMQGATAGCVAVEDVTSVVVVSTITALAADFLPGRKALWRPHLVVVALILLGAAAGAGLLQWNITPALMLSSVITGGVAIAGHRAARET